LGVRIPPGVLLRMASVPRLPIVGVIGSGTDDVEERAAAIGCWLAGRGVHLLTGAGAGVMRAVSKAFFEAPGRKGLVLGIVPSAGEDSPQVPKDGYPNDWVEVPIRTHLPLSGRRGEEPLSRNHIVVLTSALIIAMPGGPGTASEVRLALKYRRPVIAYLKQPGEIDGLPDGVRWEPDLEKVEAFIAGELAKLR
jgi:uncharacterized protein (TIGR00725 family)